jgi:hypothetical protein
MRRMFYNNGIRSGKQYQDLVKLAEDFNIKDGFCSCGYLPSTKCANKQCNGCCRDTCACSPTNYEKDIDKWACDNGSKCSACINVSTNICRCCGRRVESERWYDSRSPRCRRCGRRQERW